MSDPAGKLPPRPSMEQLRKQAKERLRSMRAINSSAALADAQYDLAREYGFESWPKLVHHVEAQGEPASSRLVTPVSRFLAVTDRDRAIAFYRDVLGFTEQPPGPDNGGAAELVSGAARIMLTTDATAIDSTLKPRPRGSAMVFFESANLAETRRAIVERGGKATPIEKVNWLKMQMFQISDPEGHILFFGQSYHEPDTGKDPKRQLRELLPSLPLSDVKAGVAYYQKYFGFHINWAEGDIGIMSRDDVTLILKPRTPTFSGIGECYAYVNDADALHAEMVQRGARIDGPPVSRPWGLRDFWVVDLEGNRIGFGQPFE